MSVSLTRLIAEASVLAGGAHPCGVLGHKWVFSGGANCGCDDGSFSIPVYECASCGDFDYGDNEEATEMRAKCEFAHPTDP